MDAVINLVPYIDLLMTIMTFLVMTAVWTQLAVLEVQNSSGGPQDEQEKEEDKPPPIFVIISETDIKVQEEGAELKPFANNAQGPDLEAVRAELKTLKDARPERVQVNVKAEDGVGFDAIARVIDVATGVELTGLTLQPASQ